MADVYGVVAKDVSDVLPGLFPAGFNADTKPSAVQVAGWITTYDTIAAMRVQDVAGTNPLATDRAAVLAQRYILEKTKEQTVRTIYAGQDPQAVHAAASAYRDAAKDLLLELEMLGSQAVGEGGPSPRVTSEPEFPTRDLLITDGMLDMSGSRDRAF